MVSMNVIGMGKDVRELAVERDERRKRGSAARRLYCRAPIQQHQQRCKEYLLMPRRKLKCSRAVVNEIVAPQGPTVATSEQHAATASVSHAQMLKTPPSRRLGKQVE